VICFIMAIRQWRNGSVLLPVNENTQRNTWHKIPDVAVPFFAAHQAVLEDSSNGVRRLMLSRDLSHREGDR
jgi:hypothetical protein